MQMVSRQPSSQASPQTPPMQARCDLRRLLGDTPPLLSTLQSAAEHWAEHSRPDSTASRTCDSTFKVPQAVATVTEPPASADAETVAAVTALSTSAASMLLQSAGGSVERAVAMHFDRQSEPKTQLPVTIDPVGRRALFGDDDYDEYDDDDEDDDDGWYDDEEEEAMWDLERAPADYWISRPPPVERVLLDAINKSAVESLRALLEKFPRANLHLRPPECEVEALASGHDWPLWSACFFGNPACAALLLEHGSQPELAGPPRRLPTPPPAHLTPPPPFAS
jgi:hypothetical protein